MTHATDPILRALRERGLRYPGAHLKSPWPGHLDLAVNDKTFAYLSIEGEPLKISCKLPSSSEVALLLPFCTPTPYGLGKSGWVSARFEDAAQIPVEMLEAWIDESYRAQAPKKLVRQLDEGGAVTSATARSNVPSAKKAVSKKAVSKKSSRAER